MWAAINRRPVLAGAKGYSLRSNQRGYGLDDVRVAGKHLQWVAFGAGAAEGV